MKIKRDGDCYETAAHMVIPQINALSPVPLIDGGWLVHGFPTLQREPFRQYGHAWVEREEDGVTWVYDFANGGDLRVPAALYYAVGNIEPEYVCRYSARAACKMIVDHEHFGGWHDGPEGAL
jgi:hypothetical protein